MKGYKSVEISNRSATYNYTVLEEIECGIELWGSEVKSIRSGMANLKGSWVFVFNNECYIKNMHIRKYDTANVFDIDEKRDRRLLLHKRQILALTQRVKEDGVALIPLRLYERNGKMKVSVGVCKGKHSYDKRESIKARDIKRNTEREAVTDN